MDKDVHKPTELDIASDFFSPSWEEWKKTVEATLKGVPFEKAMITKTYEGIDLQPIYCKEDIENLSHLNSLPGQTPFVRGNNAEGYSVNGWVVAQQQTCWNPAEANKIILNELNRGLTAVNLKLDKYTRWALIPPVDDLVPTGIRINNLEDAAILLKGIDLKAVPIMVDGGEASLIIMGLINAYLNKNNLTPEILTGFIGFDLLANLLQEGELPFKEEDKWQQVYQLSSWAANNAPELRNLLLDGSFWGNCGADSLHELVYVISSANEYIKAMLDKDLTIDQIVPRFQLNLTLGSNLFMEIAKVRAARLLWAELMKAYDVPEEMRIIWIHGITSSFNKTIYDPYVNVLRTATESFSGVIGGVDSLEVVPFDSRIKPDSEFSRRIARNQQIILMEEVHLRKVTDPTGGCYYTESLTAQLAENAWTKMQEIEKKGGFYQALKDSLIQNEVIKTSRERMLNANKRKDIYIGINMFANNLEQPLKLEERQCQCDYMTNYNKATSFQHSERPGLDVALKSLEAFSKTDKSVEAISKAFIMGATLEEVSDYFFPADYDLNALPLQRIHATMALENLRHRVVEYQQENQSVLSVFLASMGPVSQHKARSDFSQGFLQIGGFYVTNNDGFTTVEEAVDAAIFSKAQAVCICSMDDTYAELVPQLISKISAQKPDMIFLLAGYPQDMVETYKSLGIDIFIHLKANSLEVLADLAGRMGVK